MQTTKCSILVDLHLLMFAFFVAEGRGLILCKNLEIKEGKGLTLVECGTYFSLTIFYCESAEYVRASHARQILITPL